MEDNFVMANWGCTSIPKGSSSRQIGGQCCRDAASAAAAAAAGASAVSTAVTGASAAGAKAAAVTAAIVVAVAARPILRTNK